ncbi:3-carboxyethylcatechol 2,3-dioxygenase [Nitrincola nitratireducens]|uniref:2,3-dihydroxyphenylpropionate/2,3-dihydroxicinnamic acid 1,2-dioxygenase n=1 Tax=Nitrincola nitratireducens TaxID=1229521 RepID=W9VMV0_9GAMM|nr:3-carboxyethylcatechol 2,3-dioxygenase [Nitrincola nitratireducens]EXJ11820.1 2,3-dihydroxyphenylpropionate/2,3-dihydroxicinnamic acid 1,2-dioxygenase [Nitrincola nitratireducens]
MKTMLHCMSHSPLVGFVDPSPEILDEVNGVIANARKAVKAFDPDLVVLFAPDHYNGFFYDLMPSFCIGTEAYAIGDFGTLAGDLNVPQALAENLAASVLDSGVDVAVSYRMQLDHGFAQPLDELVGGLDCKPVIPIFINSVAVPLPSFQRARLLGEAVGRYLKTLDKKVLILGSGGLSHQPPVPELATANAHMVDRMKGSGRYLPDDEREARTQRVIAAARRFVEDQSTLHPLHPEWDQSFMTLLSEGRMAELDAMKNDELSAIAGKSTHEVKAWVSAFAALSVMGHFNTTDRYYRPIPEWIAGFGSLTAYTEETL